MSEKPRDAPGDDVSALQARARDLERELARLRKAIREHFEKPDGKAAGGQTSNGK